MFNTHLHVVSPLGLADLPAMQAHLKRLDEIDRVQRFAQPASDQVIDRYLEHLNFLHDAFYGAHADTDDPQRPLVGLCHLALSPNGRFAEIGVSVDAACRRHGIAKRLLERATLHAINLGVEEVVMYFLPYNTSLIELARRHGMSVSVGNGDGIARLARLSPSPVSVAAEWAATMGELTERSVRHLSEGACEASATVKRLALGEAG